MTNTALLLERLGGLIQQSLREDAARHGLLPIHVQVLHYLAQANHYSNLPIAIAEYFGITRGTVSQTLAVLERRGLLCKAPDSRHGKRLRLSLTPAGEAALQGSWTGRLETALEGLSVEAAELDSTLRSLLAALQQINGQRAFGVCRQCAHFLTGDSGSQCGLTGEPLTTAQSGRICREWTTPLTA